MAATRGTTWVRSMPANQLSDTTSPECAIGGREQLLRERTTLGLVGVEQRLVGAIRDDESQLPCQVVRVLKPGVHALPAHRTMDVRGVAEQEAAAVAEALGAAMVDAISREPMTGRERQSGPADLEKRRDEILEGHAVSARTARSAGCRSHASDRSLSSGSRGGTRCATRRRSARLRPSGPLPLCPPRRTHARRGPPGTRCRRAANGAARAIAAGDIRGGDRPSAPSGSLTVAVTWSACWSSARAPCSTARDDPSGAGAHP